MLIIQNQHTTWSSVSPSNTPSDTPRNPLSDESIPDSMFKICVYKDYGASLMYHDRVLLRWNLNMERIKDGYPTCCDVLKKHIEEVNSKYGRSISSVHVYR